MNQRRKKIPSAATGGNNDRRQTTRTSVGCILPELDDLRQPIIAPIPAGYQPTGRFAPQSALVLNAFLRLTAATPERRHWGFYFSFHSREYRRLVGSNWGPVRKQLIKEGAIEVCKRDVGGRHVEPYSTGNANTRPFPKKYRLAKQLRTGKVQSFEFRSRPHCKKLSRNFLFDYERFSHWDYWHFRNMKQFTIDFESVDSADYWSLLTASNLENQFHFFTICKYFRRHTLLTQLSRNMRRHLTINGNRDLSIVDVSACQPLLLGYLAANNYRPEIAFDQLNVLDRRRTQQDICKWIELCESGEFYVSLRSLAQKKGLRLTLRRWSEEQKRMFTIDYDRISAKGFKRSAIIPLFDRIGEMEANPIFKLIELEFPSIAIFIRIIKRHDHRETARACQKFESYLMQQGVMAELHSKHPAWPVASIHDAILTEACNATLVTHCIRQFFDRLGLHPKVKTEHTNQHANTRPPPANVPYTTTMLHKF